MKKSTKYSLFASQFLFIILFPFWLELMNHLHPIVLVVAWFCFSFLSLLLIFLFTKEKIAISDRTLHFALFIYTIALMVLLFFRPNNQQYGNINLLPLETILFYLSGESNWLVTFYNLGANVALFIPFGIYYRYVKKHPHFLPFLVLSVFSISVIEAIQFLTGQGNLDIDDLLLNVIGIVMGYFLSPVIQNVFVKKK